MASAVTTPTIDLGKVANDMAELQDFRLILYFSLVLMVALILERGFAAWGMRQERKEMADERKAMWATADKFTAAAKEITDSTAKVVNKIELLTLLASSAAARVEAAQDEQG